MREFKRNKETGILEVWDGNKKVGEMITMGDEVKGGSNGREHRGVAGRGQRRRGKKGNR